MNVYHDSDGLSVVKNGVRYPATRDNVSEVNPIILHTARGKFQLKRERGGRLMYKHVTAPHHIHRGELLPGGSFFGFVKGIGRFFRHHLIDGLRAVADVATGGVSELGFTALDVAGVTGKLQGQIDRIGEPGAPSYLEKQRQLMYKRLEDPKLKHLRGFMNRIETRPRREQKKILERLSETIYWRGRKEAASATKGQTSATKGQTSTAKGTSSATKGPLSATSPNLPVSKPPISRPKT